jgi:hypothetical protein
LFYVTLASLPDPITVRGQPDQFCQACWRCCGYRRDLLLTNNWSRWIGKLPLLDPILRLLPVWLRAPPTQA